MQHRIKTVVGDMKCDEENAQQTKKHTYMADKQVFIYSAFLQLYILDIDNLIRLVHKFK